jgi:hypothetical protein
MAVNTTFILGAGFSFDAGFPLMRDLRHRLLKFIEFDRHSSYAMHLEPIHEYPNGQFYAGLAEVDPGDKLQFEELFSRLRNVVGDPTYDGPAYVTEWVLRVGCARMFWCLHGLSPYPEPFYRSFASWLGRSDGRKMIVSFNWDVVTETALTEAGISWSYSLSQPAMVPVLKPHGSINWNGYLRKNYRNDSHLWCPLEPASGLSYMAATPLKNPDQQVINPDLAYAIFPGDPDLPEQDEDLRRIWGDVKTALAASDKAVFIGYSLPDYDCFASEFFREHTARKEIEVYNPTDLDLQKYKRLSAAALRLHQEGFASCPYAR